MQCYKKLQRKTDFFDLVVFTSENLINFPALRASSFNDFNNTMRITRVQPTEGPADFEIHQHSLTAVKHAFRSQ